MYILAATSTAERDLDLALNLSLSVRRCRRAETPLARGLAVQGSQRFVSGAGRSRLLHSGAEVERAR